LTDKEADKCVLMNLCKITSWKYPPPEITPKRIVENGH